MKPYYKIFNLANMAPDSLAFWNLPNNKERAIMLYERMKRFKTAKGYSVEYIQSVLDDGKPISKSIGSGSFNFNIKKG